MCLQASRPMRPQYLVWCLLLGLSLAGCDRDPAQRVAARQHQAEVQQLVQVRDLLTKAPLPSDVELFLSAPLLNSALQGMGVVKTAIPQLGDATLTFSNIRVAFKNGYPGLDLDSRIDSPERGIAEPCSASAILELDSEKNQLQVVVQGVAPVTKLPFLDLSLHAFWRKLDTIAAQNKLPGLPYLSLPFNARTPMNLNSTALIPVAVGIGDSGVAKGGFSLPAINAFFSLRISRALYLEDGLHLYLTAGVTK
jgi:hypothetical protein